MKIKKLKIKKKVPKLQEGGNTLDSIYTQYPGLKALGNVGIKADTSFTRDKTGAGDIEFFMKGKGDTINYGNGYQTINPNPGGFGVLYNPNKADQSDIMRDLLHGMRDVSPEYAKARQDFTSVYNKQYSNRDNYYYNKDSIAGNAQDGREQWNNNQVDGAIRQMFIKGTAQEQANKHYYKPEQDQYMANLDIRNAYNNLNNIITTPPRTDTNPRYGSQPINLEYKYGGMMKYPNGGWDYKFPIYGKHEPSKNIGFLMELGGLLSTDKILGNNNPDLKTMNTKDFPLVPNPVEIKENGGFTIRKSKTGRVFKYKKYKNYKNC